jgi:hypothetical protein
VDTNPRLPQLRKKISHLHLLLETLKRKYHLLLEIQKWRRKNFHHLHLLQAMSSQFPNLRFQMNLLLQDHLQLTTRRKSLLHQVHLHQDHLQQKKLQYRLVLLHHQVLLLQGHPLQTLLLPHLQANLQLLQL